MKEKQWKAFDSAKEEKRLAQKKMSGSQTEIYYKIEKKVISPYLAAFETETSKVEATFFCIGTQ